MSHGYPELDSHALLARVASKVPPGLRSNVVVIGSIATAWAFRDVLGTGSVATKDIDLLLWPAVDAVTTAETLGQDLLKDGWQPRFSNGRGPGTAGTPDEDLPALRLTPPGGAEGWFVELLAAPPANQTQRKCWRRFVTARGVFGLPSFRYMPMAIFDAGETPFGLRVATPACMALAHLLEHAQPDRTSTLGLADGPPRFVKDVGRAISLWWLAGQQSVTAARDWQAAWNGALAALYPKAMDEMRSSAQTALRNLDGYLRDAHRIAIAGVLAPAGTTFDAYQRAYDGLLNSFA